ncbi:hypothetical protein ACIQBJ_13815 [Kitasatospora sp. NPDC088391]|uniref:hypothetical protein n=1 Tax=Kitasatospora sp. NPDC088391 TaxID=3364074 RepID=UPI00381E614B
MVDLVALATVSANALTTAAGTAAWAEIRERVVRMLARADNTPDGRAETLADLDRTAGEVAAADPRRAEDAQRRAANTWRHRFLDLLEQSVGDDREALLGGLEELAALARDRSAGGGITVSGNVNVQATNGSVAAHHIGRVDQGWFPDTEGRGPTGRSPDLSVGRDAYTVHEPPYLPPLRWPVQVGGVPHPAAAFRPRPAVREGALRVGASAAQVLSGGAGTGKTQLAARYAREALASGTELVLWVDASLVAGIVSAYAEAGTRVHVTGRNREETARAFLDWLTVTDRSWLVVLDGLTDLEAARPWWPLPTRSGRVLATTRRRDAAVTAADRVLVEVGAFTAEESVEYVRERFAAVGMAHLGDSRTADLAEYLGHLPLALAHAATLMIDEYLGCSAYLDRLTDRVRTLGELLTPEADVDGYGRSVAASLLTALESADRRGPTGFAGPALRLAAHLDPAGHPDGLWATAAVGAYLGADPDRARAAMRLLHQHHLLQHADGTVRLHPLTARAAREATPADELPALAETLTAALAELRAALPATAGPVLDANAAALADHLPHLAPAPAPTRSVPEPPPATDLYGLFS